MRTRRLTLVLKWAAAATTVAVTALYAVGIFYQAGRIVHTPSGGWCIGLEPGRLCLTTWEVRNADSSPFLRESTWYWIRPRELISGEQSSWRDTSTDWWYSFSPDEETTISVPLWLLLAITTSLALWLFWLGGRPPPGRCPKCRYDLSGLAPATACPECGSARI